METDLNEFSFAPINNVVNNKICLQWSQDNKISVVQKENIDILNFRPKVTQVVTKTSYERCVLTISQEYPVEKTGIDVTTFLYRLDRNSVYNMFLDPSLVPRIDLCRPISPEFVHAIWSPAGLLSNNQCVLLTLSNLGSAQMHIHKENSMFTLGDINECWLKEIEKEWEAIAVKTIMPLYEQHKKRAYQLHITAICWSAYYDSYCYLIAGHNSGDIAIWKINNINIEEPKVIPKFIMKFKTSDSAVSALQFSTIRDRIFIFIGYVNGYIEGLHFEPNKNTLDTDKKIDIWSDNDKIKITTMVVLELRKNFILVSVKGLFIIATLMDTEGKIIHTATAAVASYYITGIQHIERNEFLICTISGEIINLKIITNNDESSIELQQTEISNQLDFENFGAFGVACSKVRSMWAFVLSPVKVFDHLIMKQPTMLKFCTWKRFDPIEFLKENPSKMLTDYWECMDYLRQKVVQNKMLPEWPIYSKEDKQMSVYEIKILFWLATELNTVTKRQAKAAEFDTSLIEDLRNVINIKHVINLFKSLHEKYKKAPKKLPKLELRIIRNCRDFLKQYAVTENIETLSKPLYDQVTQCYKEAAKVKVNIPPEKCVWCMENLNELKCPNSHALVSSCMITLLQVSSLDYLQCSICERIAHVELKEQSPVCIFCDIPLIRKKFAYHKKKNILKSEPINIITKAEAV